jgi:hypothetical protein
VRGQKSIAHLVPERQRCGVYVLHLDNDTHYVGQSKNVVQRYQQHCKTYDTIIALSYKRVAQKHLDQEEIHTIYELEAAGLHLLNIVHTSVTYHSSEFDLIMRPEDQRRWLDDLDWIDTDGPRPDSQEQRVKTDRKLATFQRFGEYEEAVALLRLYVQQCIPAFKRTEWSHWAISCLPSTLGGRRLATVNMSTMETFFLHNADAGGEVWLNIAFAPLQAGYPTIHDFAQRHPNIVLEESWYEAAGFDQASVISPGLHAMHELLNDPVIRKAARLLNLQLMRKRGVFYRRFHCFALADQLVGKYQKNP